MKRLMIAVKFGKSLKSVILVSAIVNIKSMKKLFKKYPELKGDEPYKILISNSGNSYLEILFADCKIEYTCRRLYFNGKTHLLNSDDLYGFDVDYLIYADVTEKDFKPELFEITEYE